MWWGALRDNIKDEDPSLDRPRLGPAPIAGNIETSPGFHLVFLIFFGPGALRPLDPTMQYEQHRPYDVTLSQSAYLPIPRTGSRADNPRKSDM